MSQNVFAAVDAGSRRHHDKGTKDDLDVQPQVASPNVFGVQGQLIQPVQAASAAYGPIVEKVIHATYQAFHAGLDTALRLGTLVSPVTLRPAGVIAKAAATPDLGDDDWQEFVCAEAVNVRDQSVNVEPGGRHLISQTISII